MDAHDIRVQHMQAAAQHATTQQPSNCDNARCSTASLQACKSACAHQASRPPCTAANCRFSARQQDPSGTMEFRQVFRQPARPLCRTQAWPAAILLLDCHRVCSMDHAQQQQQQPTALPPAHRCKGHSCAATGATAGAPRLSRCRRRPAGSGWTSCGVKLMQCGTLQQQQTKWAGRQGMAVAASGVSLARPQGVVPAALHPPPFAAAQKPTRLQG